MKLRGIPKHSLSRSAPPNPLTSHRVLRDNAQLVLKLLTATQLWIQDCLKRPLDWQEKDLPPSLPWPLLTSHDHSSVSAAICLSWSPLPTGHRTETETESPDSVSQNSAGTLRAGLLVQSGISQILVRKFRWSKGFLYVETRVYTPSNWKRGKTKCWPIGGYCCLPSTYSTFSLSLSSLSIHSSTSKHTPWKSLNSVFFFI